ncbi:MAG: AI-2E family transporter [Chloroflexi bacterium]|nr:AI-2E family transporter [Chloroflexota bacterium]
MGDPSPPQPDGIDWAQTRDILISVLILGIIVYAVGMLARHILQTVLAFLVASLLAFAVLPLVDGLTARHLPRWLAVLVVYIGLLVMLVVGVFLIGGQLVNQLTLLATQVPAYTLATERLLVQLQLYLQAHGINLNLNQQLGTVTSSLQAAFSGVLGQSLHVLSGLTSAVVSVVLVVFFSIYLVADAHRISASVPLLLPRRYRQIVRFVEAAISDKVGGFIRGQLVMALIVAITTGVVATVLHVHFPLIVGVVAFFFELIPTVGPVLIGLMLTIIAIFQSFGLLIAVLVFYAVLHTIESNVLGPRVVGHAVGLPPFVSLIAIVAGAEVGGILGALFAVPATALVVALVGAAIEEWRLADTGQRDTSGTKDSVPPRPS